MVRAVKDLDLVKLFVVHPGELDYPLDEKIEAVAFHNLPRLFPILG